MRKAVTFGLAILAFLGLSVPVHATAPEVSVAHCGPPCGLIQVSVTITAEKWNELTFGAEKKLTIKGQVEYYFDVDMDGYAYDPEKEVMMDLTVNAGKMPPWLTAKVEPARAKVPVRSQDGCTDCVQPEGSAPGQLMFRWVLPITITVEKTRDYEAAEVAKFLRYDGMYRVSIYATTPESLAGSSTTGQPAGLLEGFGVKDLRFLPETGDAVQGSRDASQTAPGPAFAGALVAAAAAVIVLRRRDD